MPAKELNVIVDQRYDFVFLFDVKDGNPNGDPDAGNLPRIDPQTLQGFTTDGCVKRKIRNAVEVIRADAPTVLQDRTWGLPVGIQDGIAYLESADSSRAESKISNLGYEIYFKQQGVLNQINDRAFQALKIQNVEGLTDQEGDEEEGGEVELKTKRKGRQVKDPKTAPARMELARLWMCKNFYDVRTFGAVMSTGVNAGQVRGPVQITYARSIDPILPTEATITRKSVNKQDDADKQILKHGFVTGTMGRKNTVPYGLYRGNGFVNAHLAMGRRGTGFTYDDLKLFFDAMLRMFDFDSSSSHGTMALREIHVFEHDSPLGRERAFKLLERIKVKPIIEDEDAVRRARPARSFDDYVSRISVEEKGLPVGVTYFQLPRDWDKLFPSSNK